MIQSFLQSEFARLFRFGLVGILATLVHLSVAALALWLWHELSVFVANLIAFLLAVMVSYVGHQRFTFQRRGHVGRFFLVALAGFSVNNVLLGGLIFTGTLSGFYAILVATLCVPVVVYFLSRFWVFNRPQDV